MPELKILGDPDPAPSATGKLRVVGDADAGGSTPSAAPGVNAPLGGAAPATSTAGEIPYVPRLSTIAKGINSTVEGLANSMLPLGPDPQTGEMSWHIPEAIAAPARGLRDLFERASGSGEAGKNPLRPLSPDALSALGILAGTPVGGSDLLGAAPLTAAERGAANAGRARAITENQGRAAVSGAFERGVRGGAPTASDVIEEMNKARAQGQPLTLSDVNNPELGALAGATYRQGGSARAAIKSFMTGRQGSALGRVKDLINRHLSDQSLRDTSKKLIADRSAHAKPLWDEAAKGGSMAPLEHQFETAFNEAGVGEHEAAQKVAQAQQAVTIASGKKTLAGNVYTTSHANQAVHEADQQLRQATAELQSIQAKKSAIRDRLQRAQADRTANVPGAVWSPRLQELLDQPEIQAGIKRGWNDERRNAVGKGQPFNPSEYAVIGVGKSGDPIVGAVPNMKLLMAAKEGLDAIIESRDMKVELTGRPTKSGFSYINLRDGLIAELDRLNPSYKQARDQWSGDTSSIKALDDGKHFMDKGRFSLEELPERYSEMSDNEKQFFILGVADALKERLFGSADAANKGGAIINNEATRMRLRPLFDSDAAAGLFIDSIERERRMGQTPGRIYGGSATAGRVADDEKTAEALVHAAHGIGHMLHANFLGTLAAAMRIRRLFGGKPNPALNESVAHLMTNPDVSLSETGPLIQPVPVPPAAKIISRPSPARMIPGAVAGLPQSVTDPSGSQVGMPP